MIIKPLLKLLKDFTIFTIIATVIAGVLNFTLPLLATWIDSLDLGLLQELFQPIKIVLKVIAIAAVFGVIYIVSSSILKPIVHNIINIISEVRYDIGARQRGKTTLITWISFAKREILLPKGVRGIGEKLVEVFEEQAQTIALLAIPSQENPSAPSDWPRAKIGEIVVRPFLKPLKIVVCVVRAAVGPKRLGPKEPGLEGVEEVRG
jgi:hypothetical protein